MNIKTFFTNRVPTVAVAAIAVVATAGLVAEVAQTDGTPTQTAGVPPGDGSFDGNEHRRHLALIQERADGFDVAETGRFERLHTQSSTSVHLTGFDRAERARQLRLAPE